MPQASAQLHSAPSVRNVGNRDSLDVKIDILLRDEYEVDLYHSSEPETLRMQPVSYLRSESKFAESYHYFPFLTFTTALSPPQVFFRTTI